MEKIRCEQMGEERTFFKKFVELIGNRAKLEDFTQQGEAYLIK
jgi:hypothetical protein